MKLHVRLSLLISFIAMLGCASSSPTTTRGDTQFLTSFDGLPLAYDERGPADAETSLLFIHGLCCERGFWSEQAERFSDRYRVITLDLGGHGESGTERESFTLDDMARDVQATADKLELSNLILVGHSMGGPVALLAATELYPRVCAVVAVDALHDPNAQIDLETMQPFLDAMTRDYADFWQRSLQGVFLPGADEALKARVLATANRTPLAVAKGLMASFTQFDLAAALAACPVPVRCINSSMTPTNLEALRAISPDFDAVIMQNVGHFLMLEAPDRFEKELDRILTKLCSAESRTTPAQK